MISQLARYVHPILHKSFYKLSSIVHDSDDSAEERSKLVGALNTFKHMWWASIVEQLAGFSLSAIQRLLCRCLCCLYSTYGEVVVAALELLITVLTPPQHSSSGSLLEFNPFLAETGSLSVGASPFHYAGHRQGAFLIWDTFKKVHRPRIRTFKKSP